MEVFRDVSTIGSLEQESTTRMTPLEFSDVKDEIVQDYKLLITFLYYLLKLFIVHDIQWLIESDRTFPHEALVRNFKYCEQCGEYRQRYVVQHSLDVSIVSVRVYAEKDSDLTRDKQDVSKYLNKINKANRVSLRTGF